MRLVEAAADDIRVRRAVNNEAHHMMREAIQLSRQLPMAVHNIHRVVDVQDSRPGWLLVTPARTEVVNVLPRGMPRSRCAWINNAAWSRRERL